MLKPQQCCQSSSSPLLNKPFIHGNGSVHSHSPITIPFSLLLGLPSKNTNKNLRVAHSHGNNIKARLFQIKKEKTTKVTTTVIVQRSTTPKLWKRDFLSEKTQDIRDKSDDFLGVAGFSVEFVSAEKDPETGKQRRKKCFPTRKELKGNDVHYEAKVDVPLDFGEVGAVVIENDFEREIFIKSISLNYNDKASSNKSVNFSCESWVQSKRDVPLEQHLRLFFSDKSYLPSKTPSGLSELRKEELKKLRGDGKGARKEYERIYDYDVYNDLGDPDKDIELKRPVLGGPKHPYPRRGRTGRPPAKTDISSESRGSDDDNDGFYVPRDEAFSELKESDFGTRKIFLGLKTLLPLLEDNVFDKKFPNFTDIDKMYKEGYQITTDSSNKSTTTAAKKLLLDVGSKIMTSFLAAESLVDNMIKFRQPPSMDMDKFFWFRDEEFARQTLAGLNPCCIQLVKQWPLKSELDPAIYGRQESKLTTELVDQQIKAYDYNLLEAIKEKKLFIIDYHDVLLPYVTKTKELGVNRVLYGSRTLFFLTPNGTLMPVAIELTRPPMDGKPQWKEVYTPTNHWHSTDVWLWKLAKVHVLSHDSAVHQLISHWLRTHCVVEPYVIATNRQLSAMHPINRLLQPHLRYTMDINALARQILINARGLIESTFTPADYCLQLSSDIYDKQWRFDQQALPADLIHRGLAVEDESCEHGLRLTIEDYPYANDGLLIWDAIKQWVTDYVNHYYTNSSEVEEDEELQEWWKEIRTVGHADKKEGWPELKTREDLIEIVANMAWIASGHHAAVNFGQYAFAGYFPNRPSLTRITMPSKDKESNPDAWKAFKKNPEDTLLQCFPSQIQATRYMITLDLLSDHASDEEYLGHHIEPAWKEDSHVLAAFQRFQDRIKKIEDIIDERNENEDFKNRHGAGVLPYELLKAYSEKGVTNKGVPYSISI